jgi:chemotaxis protein CheD
MSLAAAREASRRVVVGVGDMAVSSDAGYLLVTYALGSCLGVCIHDPVARVAGLLHAMLPTATADPELGKGNPARYVDSGVTALFREAYRLGARKERIVLKVAGGASTVPEGAPDSFQIGKRNLVALRKILWKNGVLIHGEEVGGAVSRTVGLEVGTGCVSVSTNGVRSLL